MSRKKFNNIGYGRILSITFVTALMTLAALSVLILFTTPATAIQDDTPPVQTFRFGNPSTTVEWYGETYTVISCNTPIWINSTDPGGVGTDRIHYSVWNTKDIYPPISPGFLYEKTVYDGGADDEDGKKNGEVHVKLFMNENCFHQILYQCWDENGNTDGEYDKDFFVDCYGPDTEKEIGQPQYNGPSGNSWPNWVSDRTPIWFNSTDKGCLPYGVGVDHIVIEVWWKANLEDTFIYNKTIVVYDNKKGDQNLEVGNISYEFHFDDSCIHELRWYGVDKLGTQETYIDKNNVVYYNYIWKQKHYIDIQSPRITKTHPDHGYYPLEDNNQTISFLSEDGFAGVDGNTSGWSTGDNMVELGTYTWSLLNGDAEVSGHVDGSPGFLTHRGTRGLGVDGGEDDEVDSENINRMERIEISFNKPYYLNYFEVRSLYKEKDYQGQPVDEQGDVTFWLDGQQVGYHHLVGQFTSSQDDGNGRVPVDVDFTNVANTIVDGNPTIIVDKIVFYVDINEEYVDYSEFAVAKLVVKPAAGYLKCYTPVTLSAEDFPDTVCKSGLDGIFWRYEWDSDGDGIAESYPVPSESGAVSGVVLAEQYWYLVGEIPNIADYWWYVYNDCDKIQFTDECQHDLYYFAIDKLGNYGQVNHQVYYVDNTPPVVSRETGDPQYPGPNSDTTFITTDTTINLSATDITNDCQAGVESIFWRYEWNGQYYPIPGESSYPWDVVSGEQLNEDYGYTDYDHVGDISGKPGFLWYRMDAEDFVEFEFDEECIHTLYYWAKDNVCHPTDVYTHTYYVDITPPVSQINVHGNPISESNFIWIDCSDYITIECNDKGCPDGNGVGSRNTYFRYEWDDGTGLISYPVDENDDVYGTPVQIGNIWYWIYIDQHISWSDDCVHTLYYFNDDLLGNTETPENSAIFRVDCTPPVTTKTYGTPFYNDGTNDWISCSTPITLTAEDFGCKGGVGVNKIYYRWYKEGTTPGSFQEYTAPFIINEECIHVIEYYSTDLVDNTETTKSQTVRVDCTPPDTHDLKVIGTPQYGTNGLWVTTSTEFSFDLSTNPDEGCNGGVGLDELKYRIIKDPDNDGFGDADDTIEVQWTTYTAGTTFTMPSTCHHKIEWYGIDLLGNEETYNTQEHYVDDTPPITEKTFEGPTYSHNGEPDNFWLRDHDTWVVINATEDYTDNYLCDVGVETLYVELWWDSDSDNIIDTRLWARAINDGNIDEPDHIMHDFNTEVGKIQYKFQIDEDCLHEIRWYAVDKLGNTEGEPISQVVNLFYDDFEGTMSDLNAKWDVHDHGYVGDDVYLSDTFTPGDQYVVLKDDAYIIASFDATEYDDVTLSYDRRTYSLGSSDRLVVLWRIGSSGWTQLETVTGNSWETKTWDLDGAEHQSLVQVKFFLNDGNYDYGLVDDVVITGTTTMHLQDHRVDSTPPKIVKVVGEPSDYWGKDEYDHDIWDVTSDTEINLDGTYDQLDPCAVGLESVKYKIWYQGQWSNWFDYTIGDYITFDEHCTHYLLINATDYLGNYALDNETFIVHDEIGEAPNLVSPEYDALLDDNTPTFVWMPVPDREKYRVEWSTDIDFATFDYADVTGTEYEIPSALADGKYYWRVAVIYISGYTGQWSPVWTFTIDTTAPIIESVSCDDADKTVVAGAEVTITVHEQNDETGLSGTLTIDGNDYGLTDNLDGTYSYTWAIPESQPAYDYNIEAKLIDAVGLFDTNSSLTITVVDTSGPTSHILEATVNPVSETMQFLAELTSDEAIIVAAQYRIDLGGTSQDIPANWLDDDPYDATYEYIVSDVIDVASLSYGEHVLFVRAQDENSNWGAWDEEEFIVPDTDDPCFDSLTLSGYYAGTITISTTGTTPDTEKMVFEYSPDSGTTWYPIVTDWESPFEAQFDTTEVDDGTCIIRATAYDYSNNTCSRQAPIDIDNTAPVVEITAPLEGSEVSGTAVTVSFTAIDAGVNGVTTYFELDGETQIATGSPYTWDTTGLIDGEHIIKIIADDSLGNEGYDWILVTVDNTPECIAFISPIAGEWYTEDLTAEVTAPDDTSKVVFTATDMTPDYTDNDGSDGWTATIPTGTGDGACVITATAYDELGELICARQTTVMRDNMPPDATSLDINDPDHDGYDTDGDLTLTWFPAVDGGVGVAFYEGEVSMDSGFTTGVINSGYITELFASFNDVPMDGMWYARVRAIDDLGNIGLWSNIENIIVDRFAPDLTITSPANDEYLDGTESIKYSATDANTPITYEVFIDGTSVYTGDSPYSWDTTTCLDGTHTIKVKATDDAGNTAEEEITVQVDNTPGSVSIIYPVDGQEFNNLQPGETVVVTVTAPDNTDYVEFTGDCITGIQTDNDPEWEYTWNLGDCGDGYKTITAKAYDENGDVIGSDSVTVNVISDTTPPVVTITNPTNGTSTGANLELNVETNEDATCTYQIDSGTWTTMTNTGTITHSTDIGPLTDGQHTITVNATDPYDNSGFDTVTWIVTLTGPTTSGTDVIPDSSIIGDSIKVTATTHSTIATISDADFYIINSTGATVLSGKMEAEDGSFDGETSEDLINNTINTTGWNPGEYTIHVRGQDSNGHWGAFDEEEFNLVQETHWRPIYCEFVEPEEDTTYDITCESCCERYVTAIVDVHYWDDPTYNDMTELIDNVKIWLDSPYGAPDQYFDVTWNSSINKFTAEIPVYMYSTGSTLDLEAKAQDQYGNKEYDDVQFTVITTVIFDQWMEKGWNSLTLPDGSIGCNDSVESVLASINNDNFNIVSYYNESEDKWYSYVYGEPTQTLNKIEPGKEYWINITGEPMRFYVDTNPPYIEITDPEEVYSDRCEGPSNLNYKACDLETKVTMVYTQIYDRDTCSYWNGTHWVENSVWLECEFDSQDDGWTYWEYNSKDILWISGHTYDISAYATDAGGCGSEIVTHTLHIYKTSILVEKTVGDEQEQLTTPIDTPFTFTIYVENNGDTTLSNINITDYLSDSFTYLDDAKISINDASFTNREPDYKENDNHTLSWYPGVTMNPGDHLVITFNASISSCDIWEENTAIAEGDSTCGPVSYTDNASVYGECPEPCNPDMEVTKLVWNASKEDWADEYTASYLEEIVEFNITIHNNATCCDLTNISVLDTLPNGLKYHSTCGVYYDDILLTLKGNYTFEENNGRLWWNFTNDGFASSVPYCHHIYIYFSAQQVTGTGDLINHVDVTADCSDTKDICESDSAVVHFETKTPS